jgi:hypothetical protein
MSGQFVHRPCGSSWSCRPFITGDNDQADTVFKITADSADHLPTTATGKKKNGSTCGRNGCRLLFIAAL